MSDEKRYVPLSERLNQDVWHDNFVPKYSALASAQPSRLVLTGVWLIFAPMAMMAALLGPPIVAESPNLPTAMISSLWALGTFILAVAILYTQTRRYLRARGDSEIEPDE